MQYPLRFSFKKIALANKVTTTDSTGAALYFAQQKMFKLKEKIQVYSDDSKTQQIAEINADRVIDFSPVLSITDNSGKMISQVIRQGKKSIWKANYTVQDAQGQPVFYVKEDDPWVKVIDVLLSELPFLGFFSGYFFNPSYSVTDTNGAVVARIQKEKSFFEASYLLTLEGASQQMANSDMFSLSMLVVVLRERFRG